MNDTSRNTPLDVCRVIGIALLADNKVDDREVEALTEMGVGKTLGVSPAEFRKLVQDLCKNALIDDSGRVDLPITDLDTILDMTVLLGRETPVDRKAVADLVDLIRQEDPDLLATKMLDRDKLDAALDRITDSRLKLWTAGVLLRLVNADKELDAKEKLFVSYALKRWGITPDMLV